MELSDEEISILNEVLWDEVDRDIHEPGRRDSGDQLITSTLYGRVRDEAKRRKLWWAR